MKKLIILALLAIPAFGAYSNGYSWRGTITIDYTKVLATETDFPVLISSTDANLATEANGGKVKHASGYDIVFHAASDGSGTKLDHEIETWSATTGAIVAHVRIPSLSSTANTVIYVFAANASISTSQQNVAGTWNTSYKYVGHLGDGTTLSGADSTSNGNNGTLNGSPAAVAGKIAGAGTFNTTTKFVDLGAPTSLEIYSTLSISAWVKTTNETGTFVMSKDYSTGARGFSYGITTPGAGMTYLEVNAAVAISPTGTTVADGAWHHMVLTLASNGTAWIAYVDGAQVATATTTGMSANTAAHWYISGRHYSGAFAGFDGSIDEGRIVNAVLSATWIQTEYNNQSAPATFYSLGSWAESASATVRPRRIIVME